MPERPPAGECRQNGDGCVRNEIHRRDDPEQGEEERKQQPGNFRHTSQKRIFHTEFRAGCEEGSAAVAAQFDQAVKCDQVAGQPGGDCPDFRGGDIGKLLPDQLYRGIGVDLPAPECFRCNAQFAAGLL